MSFVYRTSRTGFLVGLTLALVGVVSAGARAQIAPPTELVAPGKLTYGVAASFAPFEFSQNGKLVGFDIEFAEALAGKLGLAPVPVNMEFRGLIPALQGKRVDIINSSMYINPARSEQVDFVPYMRIGQQIVVRRGNPAGVKGRGDLCGRSVAVTLGGIQETYAREDAEKCRAAGKPALTVLTLPTAQDSALSVRQGRADAYYESTAGVARIVTEMADTFQAVGEVFETGTQIGLAVRKGDAATAEALRRAVQLTVEDGTYQRLMAKYFLPPESTLF